MAWDKKAKGTLIKALGTVESNMKYDITYYPDAITIGIMQWYGARAASLLNRLKVLPEWSGVAKSIRDDVAAHPPGNWWTSRYLTKAEFNTMKPLLRSAKGKQIQHDQALADFQDYYETAKGRGYDPDNKTQAFLFWCVMYHQSPKFAGQVVRAGGPFTLNNLYSKALSHHWFRKFRSRYSKAKAIIAAWDDSGVDGFWTGGGGQGTDDPADDRDTTDDEGDDYEDDDSDDDDIEDDEGNIKRALIVGSEIHVYTKDGGVIVGRRTWNSKEFIFDQSESNGNEGNKITNEQDDTDDAVDPGIRDGSTPQPPKPKPNPKPSTPSGGEPAYIQKILTLYKSWKGKFNYTQGGRRRYPDKSGWGDCSSTIGRAYEIYTGKLGGTNTVIQAKTKHLWTVYHGTDHAKALSLAKPGDLILFGDSSRPRHVEIYFGDRYGSGGYGKNTIMGHGGGIGPKVKNYWNHVSYRLNKAGHRYVWVRRMWR